LLVPVVLHGGGCDGINNPGCFPTGGLPADIDDYFDAALPVGGPTKYFSKYLFQSSLGQCVVLGDFLDAPVDVFSCPPINPNGPADWATIIDPAIRTQFPN
jgi:hypothetical protein